MRLIQSIAKNSLLLQTVRQVLVALGESAIIASMTLETLSVPLAEKAALVRDAADQEYLSVIPAKAGIQFFYGQMVPRFRGDDRPVFNQRFLRLETSGSSADAPLQCFLPGNSRPYWICATKIPS